MSRLILCSLAALVTLTFVWTTDAAHPASVVPPAPLPALHSKAGVEFTTQGGWTIATDAAAQTLWSFPPPNHPAFPSAVKRQVVEQAGGISIEMKVLCGGKKDACDALVRSFQQLNAQMAASIREHR
jgi:hypothetical protein